MARKITAQPDKFPQFYYSLLVGLSGMIIGMMIAWNLVSLQLTAATTPDGGPDDDCWQSVGVYCLGTIFGSLMIGQLSRFYGYCQTVIVCDLFASIGWLIFCSIDPLSVPLNGQQTLAVGRFVQGLAAGGLGLIVPTYISHIVNFEMRGRMQMFHQMFIILGILFSYTLGSITTYPMMIGVCIVWPIFHMFVTFIFMPESPYYMYKLQYHQNKIEITLRLIKGRKYDVNADYNDVQQYMDRIDNSVPGKKELKQRMWIVSIGLMIFQQLCGGNTLIFYAEEIFDELIAEEIPSEKSQALAIVMLMTQLLLCMITLELVEVLGRKKMLIISAVGMCSCLLALAVCNKLAAENYEVEPDYTVSATLIITYAGFYSVGWGTVVMTIYSEIMHFNKWFSNVIYAAGQCLMLLTVYTFFDASDLVSNTYMLWMNVIMCGLSVLFVMHYVPDTRGLPLTRIQSKLHGREPCDTELREIAVAK